MSKYKNAILTAIAVSMLTLPVKAEEKFWYCKMTGRTATTVDGGAVYQNESFWIKVTRQKVDFYHSDFFEKLSVPMVQFAAVNYFRAGSEIDTLIFQDKTLHYAMAFEGAIAVTARCEDF